MKPTEQQIKEIADELDSGMRCFFNVKTGKLKPVLDFDSWMIADEEPWEEDYKEIEENEADYFEFEGFDSHESFRIMEDFTASIDNDQLRDKLIDALNRHKPFRNFKWEIDRSGKYRQQWYDFKNMRYIEWVKQQIEWNEERFK